MPVKFKNSININDQYTLPTQDGSNGQALITDGSGNISFGPVSASDSEAVHLAVKNTSGTTITKGTPVYITGNVGNSDRLEIAEADASDAAKMPAVGLLESDLIDNGEGFVSQGGYLKGLATATIDGTSTTSNDTVYVKAGGGLTMTKPTGVNYIQNIAKVARVHATNGSLVVSSILRANDVPTPLYIDHTNQRLGIGTTSPTRKLEVAGGSGDDVVALFKASGTGTSDYSEVHIANNNNDRLIVGSIGSNYSNSSWAGMRYVYATTGDLGLKAISGTGNVRIYAGSSSAERMRITSSGNVGIGTTSPSTELQVGDGTADNAARVYHSDGAYTEMRGYGLQFNRAASYIRPTGDNNKVMYFGTDGATWSTVQFDATQYDFQTNATSRFSIGTDGNATFAGDVTVGGDLIVNGTTTTLNTTTVEVEDNILQLNTTQGTPDTATATTSGISVYRGDGVTQASLIFDDADDTWDLTNNLTVAGDILSTGDITIDNSTGDPFLKLMTTAQQYVLRIDQSDGEKFQIRDITNSLTPFTINADGNVGIGTTSPSTRLQVAGTQNVPIGTSKGMLLVRSEASSHGLQMGVAPSAPWGSWIQAQDNNISTTYPLTLQPGGGNVGIGTTSPASVLHVSGGSVTIPTLSTSHPFLISGPNNSGMSIISSTGNAGQIVFGDETDADSGRLRYDHSDNSMRFWTNADERMRIDSSGKVGIGVINPSDYYSAASDLVVGGSSHHGITIASGTSRNGALHFADGITGTAEYSGYIAYSHADNSMRFAANATERMRIDSSGNVGIGNADPDYLLDLGKLNAENPTDYIRLSSTNGNSSGTSNTLGGGLIWAPHYASYSKKSAGIIAVGEGNYFRTGLAFFTNNSATSTGNYSERMRIDMDGNVGIGTTSPGAKLDVKGGALLSNERVSTNEKFPIGHYQPGETLFEIDTTWTNSQLQEYFNSSNVSWSASSDAPGGYAIYLNGSVNVGGTYDSGFPYIPVDDDGAYYMECYIKNEGTGQTHYMGSGEFDENFGSTGGNPGSYGYFVMSNTNPGSAWTKVSGYIKGRAASGTGKFELDTQYFTPLALFNYGAGTGTRACYISGWKVIRVDQPGERYFSENVGIGTTSPSAKLDIQGDGADFFLQSADFKIARIQPRGTGANLDKGLFSLFDGSAEDVRIDTEGNSWLNGGNVGIGTTSPVAKLHVKSDATNSYVVRSMSSAGTDLGGFYESSAGDGEIFLKASNVATNVKLSSNNASYFNGGNVGIGTTSPSNTTHIYKNATIGGITSTTPANAGLRIQDNGSNMYFDGNSIVLDNTGYITTAGSNDFFIGTNNATRIFVAGAGNVGIGTSSPTGRLSVEGNITSSGHIAIKHSDVAQDIVVKVITKTAAHPEYSNGSSSGYTIDEIEGAYLEFTPGNTYKFDQSDSSNSGHPLRFYEDAAKNTAYTTGVTTNGTPGSSGAYTQIIPTISTPPVLFYQCSAHSLMGSYAKFGTGTIGDTYTINASANGTNVNLNLDAASGTDSLVQLTSGQNIVLTRNNASQVTIDADDYDLGSSQDGNNVDLNLTSGTGNDNSTVQLNAGSNITLTSNNDVVTIDAAAGLSGITVQEEGSSLSTLATTLNFVGDGVTATGTGGTKTITVTGGGGGGSSTFYKDTFSGNGSTTGFTLTNSVSNENLTQIYINGVYQSKDNYSVSGTGITFTTAPPAGTNNIEVISVGSVSVSDEGTLSRDSFTGDGTTTQFTLGAAPTSEDMTYVFIQGVYQEKSTYSLSGSTLTFSTAPQNGYTFEVMSLTATNLSQATYLANDNFTGTGSQTTFTLVNGTPTNKAFTMVFLSGVYQQKSTYSLTSGAIVFGTAPANNDTIEIVSIGNGGLIGASINDANNAKYNVNVINSNTTASAGSVYVFTANLNLTLPANPTSGDSIKISNRSNVATCQLLRNGNRILGAASDLTLDTVGASFELIYSDTTNGWIIIGQ